MDTVEKWVQTLRAYFPVNVPEALEKAHLHKYDPERDVSVMDYYYAKLDLIETAEPFVRERDALSSVWIGLPGGLRKLLDQTQFINATRMEAGLILGRKDRDFRDEWFMMRRVSRHATPAPHPATDSRSKPPRREFKPKASSSRPAVTSTTTSSNFKAPAKSADKPRKEDPWAKDYPIPAEWPEKQWKKDSKGRTQKRSCRFCHSQSHFDRDCQRKPASYSVELYELSESEALFESESDNEGSDDIYGDVPQDPQQSLAVSYNTKIFDPENDAIKLPGAEKFHVIQLPPAHSVGTGISYLSSRPLPIKTWLGVAPHGDHPLIPGKLDTAGPNLISVDLVPKDREILTSPLNPRFTGINDDKPVIPLGYVVLPVYLPNKAALEGDTRNAKSLLIWVEFQVLQYCSAGYIIGRDSTRPYRMRIDEDKGCVLFPQFSPPFETPFADPPEYNAERRDHKIYSVDQVTLAPYSDTLLPVQFERFNDGRDLLVKPNSPLGKSEGTFPTCAYALMSNSSSHVHVLNPLDRPMVIRKGDVVGTFEVMKHHTPASSFSVALSTVLPNSSMPPQFEPFSVDAEPPHVKLRLINESSFRVAPLSSWNIDIEKPLDLDVIQPSVYDGPDLKWDHGIQLGLDAPSPRVDTRVMDESDLDVDPFGLKDEFREDTPLLAPPPEFDVDDREDDLDWDINPKLNRKQRRAVKCMLRKHLKVFSGKEGRLGKLPEEFDLDIQVDAKGLRSQQPYRTSPRKRQEIRKAISTLKELDIIEESNSDVASPVVVVMQNGKARFCVDLRHVNSQVVADRYVVPRQDSIFSALSGCILFTTLDANKGFHQIGLTPRSRKFTCFVTEDGQWHYKRVPFGLKTAPTHYQRVIDRILSRFRWDFALAYIDDIVIFSRSFEEHIEHISLVLSALQTVNMTLDHRKCHFGYDSVKLLGHRISRFGLSTLEEKVVAITSLPYPHTIKDAQQVLGVFNYYRQFIPLFAWIASPLYDGLKTSKPKTAAATDDSSKLTHKQRANLKGRLPFPDTPETRRALDLLKKSLTSAPVLAYPQFDRKFILHTDASYVGIAGALHQIDKEGNERPVAFISRQLKDAETRYSATEIECLGVVWCLHKLNHFLDGSSFDLYTDHSALKWIWNVKPDVNARLFRWSLQLSPLQGKVNIVHRPGRFNTNVDTLSRHPTPNSMARSYSVSLIQISDEWKERFWQGYQDDVFFKKVLLDLRRIKERDEELKGNDQRRKEDMEKARRGEDGQPESQNATAPDGKQKKVTSAVAAPDIFKANQDEIGLPGGSGGTSAAIEVRVPSIRKDSGWMNGVYVDPALKGSAPEMRKIMTRSQMRKSRDLPDSSESSDGEDVEERIEELADDAGGGDLIAGEEVIDGLDARVISKDMLDYYRVLGAKDVITDGTFSLMDKIIFFESTKDRPGLRRLCIPTAIEKDILNECHNLTGHPGIRRTYLSISSRYYFPRMAKKIRRYVNECLQCQSSKPSHDRPAGKLYPIPGDEPFGTISIDFVTGLPRSSDGFDALLTVTEKATKTIRLIPCHTTTSAEDTAQLFLKYCYPVFGLPSRIISDRDARFTSRFWKTLTTLLGIKLGLTTAYHPSADGQAERTNQIVETALRCFIGGDVTLYKKWTSFLPLLEFEFNATPHESTGYSPNELRLAIPLRGIPDIVLPPSFPSSDAAETLIGELRNRRDEAKDSIRVAQRKQKKYYDSKRTDLLFHPGDLVMLKYNRFGAGYKPPSPHNHKLAPTSTPLRIKERLSPLSYRVDLPPGSSIHDVVSIVHLKKFRGEGSEIRPTPIVVDGAEEWTVESIDGERTRDGCTEYLVRWEGYDERERTWEPLKHLRHAQEKLLKWRSGRPDPVALKRKRHLSVPSTSPSVK